MNQTVRQKRVLLLQGPSSPFFARVGRALRALGADVTRIGFCPGDRLYWSRASGTYVPYSGDRAAWPGYLRAFVDDHGVTDILMLGDGRDVHADAVQASRTCARPPRVWIVEHGYLRPGLLTVEPWGTGGRSRVPGAFRAGPHDGLAMAEPQTFRSSFLRYAALDVGYHLANLLLGWALYPRYRGHALDGPLREWRGWIGKALRARARGRDARRTMTRIRDHTGPVFLHPLQLETDYQIRDHAPHGGVAAALEHVVAAFGSAPADALLVVKVHPMDNGLAGWRDKTLAAAALFGLEDRVVFLDGGDLDAILDRAAGCVTINSTVGLTALIAGCPVATLGTAIYAHPGLTDTAPLPDFFASPSAPDTRAVAAFVGFLNRTVHVPGAFEGEGAAVGARNVAARILKPPVFPMDIAA